MARNHRIRFGANNFLDALASSDISVLSEMSGFGKANLLDSQRSKVYRTNGNFTIDSTNNSIPINDGSDKAATLTSGNYDGPDAMATHVQTQLNAVSTNWTCTWSSTTRKFTIARSSGTDTLRLATTTNAAWDTLGFTGASNISAATQGAADESRNHTNERIVVDLGTNMTITEFHLITALDEVFSISSNATLKIMLSTMDSWVSPAVTVTPTRDAGGIHHYLDDEADTTYRYMAFDFVDRQNIVGPQGFKIGHLYVGDYDTVTTTNVAPRFIKGYNDRSEAFESDSGAKYYRTRTARRVFSDLQIGFIEASERVALETLFESVGVHTPFYLSLDPLNNVSTTLSEVTMYGRFTDPPQFRHLLRDQYSMQFRVEETA